MRAALFVLAFALQLYALLDCARTPEENMPARMPKFMWVVLIILVPTVGAIAWIIVSRVSAAERRGGYVEPTVWSSREGTSLRRPERPRPLAPDDDTDFLRDLEQDLRRRRHHPDTPDTTTQGRRVPGTSDTQSTWDASGQAGTGRTAPGSAGASEHPQDPGRAQVPDGSAPADPGAPGSEEKRGGMADRKGQKEGQNPPEDPSPSDPDGTAGPSGGPDSGSAPCKP
ncbi:PLDc_N domain-containing protein [Actinomyces lilanjuaniae]|uniref:PLDc_N domain-containing protein n=1 Tax=Actinomyces lilanjuaniae TaxID=2321394 RepID=A0ABM6Z597_9ACTO|nr:PLDc_N domain-containing protein [Actinomyces lilanjuaniae]